MKKTPRILSEELKFHSVADGIIALADYNWFGIDARTIVMRLKKNRRHKLGRHYGDPCRYCGVAQDSVPVGDCRGNK